jgi:hypothetical protein
MGILHGQLILFWTITVDKGNIVWSTGQYLYYKLSEESEFKMNKPLLNIIAFSLRQVLLSSFKSCCWA